MAITLDGTAGITTPDLTDTSLTATRVVYAGTSGNLTGSSALTFDGGSLLISGDSTLASTIAVRGSTTVTKGTGFQSYFSGSTYGGVYWDAPTDTMRFESFVNTEMARFTPTGTFILKGSDPTATGVGITFPPTQVASSNGNTLDDYEEGTWTPAGNGVTYTSAEGNYTKIGDFVFCTYYFTFPSTASTSTAEIQGLPFAINSGTAARGTFSVCGVDTSVNPIYGALTASKVIFRDTSNNNRQNVAFTTASLTGMIIYRV